MLRIIILLIALVLNSVASAQVSFEEKAIKQTIETFFEGLHKGDSTVVSSTFHSTIKLQTTATNKEGEKIVKTNSRQNF